MADDRRADADLPIMTARNAIRGTDDRQPDDRPEQQLPKAIKVQIQPSEDTTRTPSRTAHRTCRADLSASAEPDGRPVEGRHEHKPRERRCGPAGQRGCRPAGRSRPAAVRLCLIIVMWAAFGLVASLPAH